MRAEQLDAGLHRRPHGAGPLAGITEITMPTVELAGIDGLRASIEFVQEVPSSRDEPDRICRRAGQDPIDQQEEQRPAPRDLQVLLDQAVTQLRQTPRQQADGRRLGHRVHGDLAGLGILQVGLPSGDQANAVISPMNGSIWSKAQAVGDLDLGDGICRSGWVKFHPEPEGQYSGGADSIQRGGGLHQDQVGRGVEQRTTGQAWSIRVTAEGLIVESGSWWSSAPALEHQIVLALDIAGRLTTLRGDGPRP